MDSQPGCSSWYREPIGWENWEQTPTAETTAAPTAETTAAEDVVFIPHLLDLPPEVLEFLISRMSFENVAKFRMVNRDWRHMCDRVLVRGYVQIMDANWNWQARVHSLLPPRLSDYKDHELLPPLRMAEALEESVKTLNIVYVRGGLMDSFPAGKVLDLAQRTQQLIATFTEDHTETIKWLDLTRSAAMKARVHFEKHWPFTPKPKLEEPIIVDEVEAEFEIAHQELLANISKLEEILAAQKPKFDKLYELLRKAEEDREAAAQKGEVTEVLKEEVTEVLKEEVTEVLKEEVTEVLKEEGNEVLKEEVTEVLKEEVTEVLKEEVTEVLKEEVTEVLKEEVTEVLKVEVTEVLKEEVTADDIEAGPSVGT